MQEIDLVVFVARGEPQAHPREQREAVPGLAREGIVGWLPLGVVPPPPAGASYARTSRDSLPRATVCVPN
ncbi:hypothetical protein QT231_11830 [Halomonas sp. SpR1]|uniref:hypothetical protein n=1 Tax=Halomonas sp. SpR1 TaxID=3050462 RepID=UPI0027E5BB66|nr:hypothetical protein [Halomonas sp. SpR1]MDQ7733390.1 hypothetical protein [Halomonas sp. SpR1]